MKVPDEIIKASQTMGFDTAKYVCHWKHLFREYDVYVPCFDKPTLFGRPCYLLFRNGKITIASERVSRKISDFRFNQQK